MMTAEGVASRRFEMDDQERFARFCGDRNPMHLDWQTARRTQAGACAVHGVHGVLWALEHLAEADEPVGSLQSLSAEFKRFVAVGQEVVLHIVAREAERLKAELRVEGAAATTLDLRFGPRLGSVETRPPGPGRVPEVAQAIDLAQMEGRAGFLAVAGDGAEALFPGLCAGMGHPRVIAIGLSSTLVGMEVPGLHSIFSGLSLRFVGAGGPAGLRYAVRRADARFRLVTAEVEGPGMVGTVRAFVRFPLVGLPRLDEVMRAVAPHSFAGRRALVIGGSRGIGAATAMILAAGGAQVVATYHRGRAEAEALRDEIGAAHCRILAYDALAEPGPQLAPFGADFTHVYYFATGRIGPSGAGFDRAAFDAYAAVYLDGFARLAAYFGAVRSEVQMLWPSSVYVGAWPRGLGEYAMVKAAGEVLCADLEHACGNLRITAPRLPRVLTDQTATVPPVAAEDPVEVMLPILRREAE